MASYSSSRLPLMALAGSLVALGGLMMLAKGVTRSATGGDPSLVPVFGTLTNLGLAAVAIALYRSPARWRWLAVVGGAFALVGVVASLVAVGYLLAGTIPETEGASAVVGGSYAVLTVGVVGSLLILGIVIAMNRSLPGGWRWLPLGLLVAQFPIFIIGGAIGDVAGSDDIADGLSLALAGAAWVLLGYGLTLGVTRHRADASTAHTHP